MFKKNEMMEDISIDEAQFGGTFKKVFGHRGNKLIYLSKKTAIKTT